MAVVVVAYGAEDLLEACLSSVSDQDTVVVVDNASRPECAALCREHQVDYLDPGANLGFAGGVNIALGHVHEGSDVLLLNPDARLGPGDLDRLLTRLRTSSGIAAVAPCERHPDTLEQQRVAWPFPSPSGRWLEAVGLGRLNQRADFLIGSVLLLAGSALSDVGAFDERYFLYCEETDWQRRARDQGWRVELVPEVTAYHVGAGTSSSSVIREAYFHAGQELYIRKWFGRRGWLVYRAACLAGDGVRALTGGGRARAARARLVTYREGPVRRRDRLLAEAGR